MEEVADGNPIVKAELRLTRSRFPNYQLFVNHFHGLIALLTPAEKTRLHADFPVVNPVAVARWAMHEAASPDPSQVARWWMYGSARENGAQSDPNRVILRASRIADVAIAVPAAV